MASPHTKQRLIPIPTGRHNSRSLSATGRCRSDRRTGYNTATIELCFGATERSLEAYVLAEGGDELDDFHDHTYCYDRASDLGLLSTRQQTISGGCTTLTEQTVTMGSK